MIAKNNIFNIRKGSGTKWKGETGATKGFVEFEIRKHIEDVFITIAEEHDAD